jgi:hypothetical protein
MSECLSRDKLDALLAEQVARLDGETLHVYERYRVDPELVERIFPHAPVPGATDRVYVIAREGHHVLFYDEPEEEFGTAELDVDGVMRDWGTWGEELRWALRHFPEPRP